MTKQAAAIVGVSAIYLMSAFSADRKEAMTKQADDTRALARKLNHAAKVVGVTYVDLPETLSVAARALEELDEALDQALNDRDEHEGARRIATSRIAEMEGQIAAQEQEIAAMQEEIEEGAVLLVEARKETEAARSEVEEQAEEIERLRDDKHVLKARADDAESEVRAKKMELEGMLEKLTDPHDLVLQMNAWLDGAASWSMPERERWDREAMQQLARLAESESFLVTQLAALRARVKEMELAHAIAAPQPRKES